MSTVVLTKDHRGLGKRGDKYVCPNQGVADKLIRLGRAVAEGDPLPLEKKVAPPTRKKAAKPAPVVVESKPEDGDE